MTTAADEARIDIVYYDDRFADDFRRLNTAWLEQFDLLEPADEKYLQSPRAAIIDAGGQVLVAVQDGVVVGTCALLRTGPKVVELAKLAVAPAAQRRGLGRRLTMAAIDYARALGVKKVVLVSNSQLVPAIRLYEALGFEHAPIPADNCYATADVYMELWLG